MAAVSMSTVSNGSSHRVFKSVDHVGAGKSFAVVRCSCGWKRRRLRTADSDRVLLDAIREHWKDVAARPSRGADVGEPR